MLDTIAQLELVAPDAEEGARTLCRVLGLEINYRAQSPNVDNRHVDVRAGDSLIQVISPLVPGSAADRHLKKRGSGLYFCCFRIADFAHELMLKELLEKQTLISGAYHFPTNVGAYKVIWVHPKATHGLLMELGDCMRHPGWTGGGAKDWFEKPYDGALGRVRQLVLAVKDLDRALDRWDYMFGLPVTWRAEDATRRWAVMRLAGGDTFIELRQPTTADSEEAEFLKRGEGLFAAMIEARDMTRLTAHVERQARLLPLNRTYAHFEGFAVDPSALFGCRFDIGRGTGDNPWPPAGPDWFRSKVTLNHRPPLFKVVSYSSAAA